MPTWIWIVLITMILLLAWQQLRIFQIRRNFKKREELFQIVTENAADMIALVDVKGRRLYNSPAYKTILGYSPAELGKTSAFEQIHPDDRFKVLEAAREARATGVGKKLQYRIRHKDGSWKVLESVASAIRNQKGEVDKLVIVNRDVTERKQAEERLEHNSFHDGLTGLPNRRLFLNRLQQAFARRQRNPQLQYAILFVDIDGFKKFNDIMGQSAGDLLLIQLGLRLQACLRGDDTISRPKEEFAPVDAVLSRLGGDEFTVLLDTISDPSDSMRVANRIQAAVREPFFLQNGSEARVSASVGIAVSTALHTRPENLLQDAETAMRRAKALGGGRCEVFDQGMHSRAMNRLHLEGELRVAMEREQFEIVYQPIVELANRRIVAFEALLRWQHPEQGLISPYKFLDAAEDTGLLVSIGHWLLKRCTRQLKIWQGELRNQFSLGMAVNLSARQFAHADLLSEISESIRVAGIEPAALYLEVTENIAAANPKFTITRLGELKRLGVKIILDDFGCGACSLRLLRQWPLDALKIDKSLIAEVLADPDTTGMVEMIQGIAQAKHLQVIAEGIENVSQLERLRSVGCEFGQGYFFSHPVGTDGAERLLAQQAQTTPARRGKSEGEGSQVLEFGKHKP